MTLRLGDSAPDFVQESTEGRIHFHEWLGNQWCLLFSHAKDFTPVCTTELGAVAKLLPEFERRNVKVVGVSVDRIEEHRRWLVDIEHTQGAKVTFPVLADPERRVTTLYGMIHPNAHETYAVRSVFVIDPKKKVRLALAYPASLGRNFREILRAIDALQLSDDYRVATPADWEDGKDVIIVPAVPRDEATHLFPKGFRELKPYLRMTPQPNR